MKNLRRTRFWLVIAGIVISIVLFYNDEGLYYVLKDSYDEDDALPLAEDHRFSPKTRSIFFHETSYHGKLTARQACAVEAAARAHPHWPIYVLFSSPVTDYELKTSCLAVLLRLPNVKLLRVYLAEYSKGTIVESILQNGLKTSSFRLKHLTDILRMLTLNKWGGICLDTDMVIAKSLEFLPSNWIVKNNENSVVSGVLSFAKDDFGSNITSSILKEMLLAYNPDDWSAIGRRAIQTVIKRMCPITFDTNTCKGITIFPYKLFYPVHDRLQKVYYHVHIETFYSFHMWNYLSSSGSDMERMSYDILAKKYCPSIFKIYSEDFGV